MRAAHLIVTGTVAAVAATGATLYSVRAHHGGGGPLPLYYSGVLTEDGAPVDHAALPIDVRLYDQPTGGSLLCSGSGDVPVRDGHFTVTMDPACNAVVQANQELYLEVRAEGSAVGGRTRAGAAPFALSAESAITAQTATTAGAAAAVPWTGVSGRPPVDDHPARLAALEAGPSICGASAAASNADYNGYAAMRAQCAAAPGCGATAWVCTGEQAAQSIARGVALAGSAEQFWVVSGDFSYVSGQPSYDCGGFTLSGAGSYGTVMHWDGSRWFPDAIGCHEARRVLCCDLTP